LNSQLETRNFFNFRYRAPTGNLHMSPFAGPIPSAISATAPSSPKKPVTFAAPIRVSFRPITTPVAGLLI